MKLPVPLNILVQLLLWALLTFMLSNILVLRYEYTVNVNGETRVLIHTAGLLRYILAGIVVKAAFFYTNVFYLLRLYATEKNRLRYLLRLMAFFILFFLSECLLFHLIAKLTLNAPLETLSIFWATDVSLFIFLWGIGIGYFFIKEWLKQDRLNATLRQEQVETELKFLKSQVNPHFLFNTLNNLYSMAQEKGHDTLATGIHSLSEMMRYILYDSREQFVPLPKEIAHIKAYIELYKLRYEDGEIRIHLNEENTSHAHIAPIILLPFVENAFKHGVSVNTTSAIDIDITCRDGFINFTCSNQVHNRQTMNEHSGIGLENVRKRLDLIYPEAYTLDIAQNGSTYSVHLKLPAKC